MQNLPSICTNKKKMLGRYLLCLQHLRTLHTESNNPLFILRNPVQILAECDYYNSLKPKVEFLKP